MSTTPTELLETTAAAIEETVAAIAETTASTEAAIDIESIKEIMDGFDPAALLPDLSGLSGSLETICRVAVMIGPIVLLIMGLAYLLLAPKEANYHFGYRCYFGMGSEEAWRFTQRLAGIVWGALGLVLTVLMFFLSAGFAGKEVMDTISTGFTCILWQIGLTVASCLAINTVAMVRYNRKGEPRSAKNLE